jgi:hypothetical protein
VLSDNLILPPGMSVFSYIIENGKNYQSTTAAETDSLPSKSFTLEDRTGRRDTMAVHSIFGALKSGLRPMLTRVSGENGALNHGPTGHQNV